jgi:hypothetical protein
MFVPEANNQPKSVRDTAVKGIRQLLWNLMQRNGGTPTTRRFEVFEGSRSGASQGKARGAQPRSVEISEGGADTNHGVRLVRRHDAAQPSGNSKGELRVTVLEGDVASFKASLNVLSDKSMELSLDRPLPPGSMLKLRCGSTTWLGETYRCERHSDEGSYRAWVWLEHALYSQVNSRYASQNLTRRHAVQGA